MTLTRRRFVTALGLAPLAHAWTPATLALWSDDGVLRVHAPNLHFLEGKTLRRLQDGAGLVFSLQLSLSQDHFRSVARRHVERFVVSFDLWEERYAVMRLGPVQDRATHLSRDAAERWMFSHTGVGLFGLPRDRAHWVRAEIRADDPREAGGFLLDPALTLSRLVEWFGRAPKGESQRWTLDQGPFVPAELQR
jgi:hypothetical protein